jgi:gluconate transporter
MIDITLLWAVAIGISVLLILILYFKIQAFLSLLISSISVGLVAGMPARDILLSVQQGMASTLGFIAIVVGLGAMLGAILENSGGVQALASFVLKRAGEKRASWALMITGFLVSIPVFFDVGVVLLIPIVYALQKNTGRSLLYYGIPLLAGLAITHAFIPPTPGPVAVADILGADLGWVILFGFVAGIPAAIISGPLFGRYIAKKIIVVAPASYVDPPSDRKLPSVSMVGALLGLPLVLILTNTFSQTIFNGSTISPGFLEILAFVGHPFTALIIANLLAWYFLGIRRGYSKNELLNVSTQSLGPAGVIILITGAGGVFKEILTQTGAGLMLANYLMEVGFAPIVFGYIAAALIRLLQGSSTVAMITSAGMTAAVLEGMDYSDFKKAALVIAIAAGASIYSHVNDSGFWLVSKYFGMNETQTLRSWSVMTTLISFTGFGVSMILWMLL